MKFKTTPYHGHLLKDYDRLSVFYEAIYEYALKHNLESVNPKLIMNNSNPVKETIKDTVNDIDEENLLNLIVYDLGCGSGILSYFGKDYFNSIVSFEKESKIASCAKENLKDFENILVINEDVLNIDDIEKADLIICEMLDTGLIDEEQVPTLNHFNKYLKESGEIIPKGIFNIAEPVHMNRDIVHYEDDESHPQYELIGEYITYGEIDFKEYIEPHFKDKLSFKINKDSIVNGIKITTFTKLNENIICGPTSMLNPSMFIPLEEKQVCQGDILNIELEYIMGSGVETIKTRIL